ncbi:MAG: esterase/lipase [Oceanospirillaceae bacterium]|jgi:esterase/lipase|tara:strand:- start:73 stop:966 length:894 start_codon:yes stop_codon:yes gene_type:complete
MKRAIGWILAVVLLVVMGGFLLVTYQQADYLVHHPLEVRTPATHQPQYFDLQVQEVVLLNPNRQKLHGYFSASNNGAYVMLQHGFKANRGYMLEEAKILQEAGYGILVTSIRAHDLNDGDEITFGVREMDDLNTWYNYLMNVQGVAKGKVGLLGNSMGGAMVIEYAALNQDIAAVVAVSAFSSLQDTINVSVEYFTGLPAFPFAPMISFWAETILGMDVAQANTARAAAKLCNTPLFIMQGGQDIVVSVESGQWIYDAACGDKELWFEEALGHAKFDTKKPDEFKHRVIEFFDKSLL